ncbi:hypothetical protein KIN20_009846 [Parelaphostrongylus tenuis]|uniref:Uncharacterized protein n=1 Tax=Parelaphostrongylus tenuis TaxID=148309 RepID=A0AAD5M700_PARTN|nr:hypothetical protein KIN20_009846 [Parelaphostrongylus tenuis]
MTLVSTRNIVPVITYAAEDRELKTVLHYRIASTGSNVSQTTPEPTFVTTSRPTSRLTTPLTSHKAETPTTRETSELSVASTRQPTPNTSTIAPPNPCRDTDPYICRKQPVNARIKADFTPLSASPEWIAFALKLSNAFS